MDATDATYDPVAIEENHRHDQLMSEALTSRPVVHLEPVDPTLYNSYQDLVTTVPVSYQLLLTLKTTSYRKPIKGLSSGMVWDNLVQALVQGLSN